MPGRDGTGPWGEGPRTGWARGFCSPAGYGPRPAGQRMGFPPGRGRGRRCSWFWSGLPEPGFSVAPWGQDLRQERELLQAEAKRLRSMADSLEQRIAELQDTDKQER